MFSWYLFAVALRKKDTTSVVYAQHAYVTEQIVMEIGTAFPPQLRMTELMPASAVNWPTTLKHAQTFRMVKRAHRNLKKHTAHWDQYVDLVVRARNTAYHQSSKRTPTASFSWTRSTQRGALTQPFDADSLYQNRPPNICQCIKSEKQRQHLQQIGSFHKYKNYHEKKLQAQWQKVGD